MEIVVKFFEVVIGIMVIGLIIGYFVDIIVSPDILAGFQGVFSNLSYLLGTGIAHYIVWIFLGSLVIMGARWILSFITGDSAQKPN